MPAGSHLHTTADLHSPEDMQKKCTNISCKITHTFVINASVLSSAEFPIKSMILMYHRDHNNASAKYLLEVEAFLQLQSNRLFLSGLFS